MSISSRFLVRILELSLNICIIFSRDDQLRGNITPRIQQSSLLIAGYGTLVPSYNFMSCTSYLA